MRARVALALLSVPLGLAIASCVSRSSTRSDSLAEWKSPSFPADWRLRDTQRATHAPAAMVVSSESLATEVGLEILRRGGNAVDASVAVGFALTVTYPEAGNIGGGGYMVIRLANGHAEALDYRETAPMASTQDMFVDASGAATDGSRIGHRAAGVPAAVAGLVAAVEKHGSLPLATVLAPAIRLAENGFVVDSALHYSLRESRALLLRFGGARVFLPNGELVPRGARLTQPALARTLRRIAAEGARGFYAGPVADAIVSEMQRGGGLITAADLAAYRPIWRPALRGSYRGFALLAMPPSSSGGTTTIETLNILETYPRLPPFGSAAYTHLLASAQQRAFLDRNARLGDADFMDAPVRELTSKEHARAWRRTIDGSRATRTASLGSPLAKREGSETTPYLVVDAAGNAVATTTTLNSLYGSVFVAEAGFFLNNTMDDFTIQPGTPNMFGLVQGEQNAIVPGKRPLSAMSPTIVLDPDGKVFLLAGSRGGPRIISGVIQLIVNTIDHAMSTTDAMRAPRVHHQALPDELVAEVGGLTSAARDSLTAMGHTLADGGVGLPALIRRVPNGWEGIVDARRGGRAKGL